ncbi:hypothetical protein ONS95_011451 [Cadophora gregata]|uniref:uncharacterized protein n=1 Tax=Cadophora gregata TaxID=51156 RepID=UPI0026DA7557|nr:uncharacterized protein ONS95_011451 [Cadophora gregata]KAK0120037.1 hypothetical protein ONS95_011451 [Cadophora gregata]KAK0121070.1 hypothetical protein ONS96_011253 [Cadophora gregata f. sp. sojae]
MRFQLLFLVAGRLFLVSAQVLFSQPTEGEVMSGGVPFVLNVAESTSAPYFSQMTNFSLYLLAGSYSSPIPLFAWNLPDVNPSTIANNVNIPSDMGTNAIDAYFLGIRGTILLASTLSVTYFSPLFTLQNMTGPSSLVPAGTTRTLTAATGTATGTRISTPTSKPLPRAINCLDPNTGLEIVVSIGEISVDSACSRSAISMLDLLSTQTRSATTIPTASSASSPTTAVGSSNANNTSTSPSAQTSIGAATDQSKASGLSGRVVYISIIAALSLLAPIICLWLALRHRAAQALQPQSPSPFAIFRPLLSNLKNFAVFFGKKASQQRTQTRPKRKHSDAEKGEGLEVHVTRSLRHMSTRQSQPVAPPVNTRSSMVQRRAFEEMYTKRESRKTILAELEGDAIISEVPGMPATITDPAVPESRSKYARESVASDIKHWRTDLDQAFDSYEARRRSETMSTRTGAENERSSERDSVTTRGTTVLSEGKQAKVVRGKEVANIVTYTRKTVSPPPPLPTSSQTQTQTVSLRTSLQERDLPPIPHIAELSTLPSPNTHRTDPPIPISRFSVRSASLPRSNTISNLDSITDSEFKAKARVTQLEDEVFKREASVVVRGIEEEKRIRMVRQERRERRREELLRGGVGGSATIDMEVVRWVRKGKNGGVERDGVEEDDGEYRANTHAARSP